MPARLLQLVDVHLRRVLREYARYFNHDRPHQGLAHRVPVVLGEAADHTIAVGSAQAIPVLGGLHHAYARVA
jgi:hypothetical protein